MTPKTDPATDPLRRPAKSTFVGKIVTERAVYVIGRFHPSASCLPLAEIGGGVATACRPAPSFSSTTAAPALVRLHAAQPGQARGAESDALPRDIRVYTPDELRAITNELRPLEAAAVEFATATGMRPAEWSALERRDVDRTRHVAF